MEKILLASKKRDTKVKAKHLRKTGQIPGVLYGHGVENVAVQVNSSDLNKTFHKAGTSTLIELDIDNDKRTTLIHDVERDPISDQIIHVDFHQVNLTEKIKTEIPLQFIGEAPAVKELQGSLLTNKDHVKVEALAQDLVHEIQVDISNLKTFEDAIHVKDLNVPSNITILDEPDEVVASVQPPRSEEELAALEEEVKEDVEGVEVEEKGKVEEEGAEVETSESGTDAPAAPAGESSQKPARAGGEEK